MSFRGFMAHVYRFFYFFNLLHHTQGMVPNVRTTESVGQFVTDLSGHAYSPNSSLCYVNERISTRF